LAGYKRPRFVEFMDADRLPRSTTGKLLRHELAAMPVTARDGRLLGAITVDAAVRAIAPGSWGRQAPRVFS